ncbi:hypothetical protein RB597_003199 [Gaeumannomyces tritici]
MPLRVTDPDFESEIFEKVKAGFEAGRNSTGAGCQYFLPLPLLVLDDSAEKQLPCHEPAEETMAISAHISVRIRAFYEQIAAAYNSIEDLPVDIGIKLEIKRQDFEPEVPASCQHRRYHSRRLQLHDPETLSDLPFVTCLTIRSLYCYELETAIDTRPLSPLVLLQCLVHLPAVQEWNVPWMWERPLPSSHPNRAMREVLSWPWEGPLRDARHEFGAAIMDPEKHLCGRRIPASLTRASLHFWAFPKLAYYDQSVARPNLIHPADKDPVSVGLCKLGAQLSLFDVRAVVTPDLFPSPEAPADRQWSRMRRFRLEFHALRPDGRWYFVGPGGEDPHDSEEGGYKISDADHYPRETDTDGDSEADTEYCDEPGDDGCYSDPDSFRIEPCRERIEPLLAAFARALARDNMPCLEDAEVFTYLWYHPSDDREAEGKVIPMTNVHRWGVKLIAGRGGETKKEEDGDAAAPPAPTPPVVQWQVGDWRPSQEVMSLFESLGRQEWLDFEWHRYRPSSGPDLLGNYWSSGH